jgi:hypothetical protein
MIFHRTMMAQAKCSKAEAIDPEAMTIILRAAPTSGAVEGSRYAFANVS